MKDCCNSSRLLVWNHSGLMLLSDYLFKVRIRLRLFWWIHQLPMRSINRKSIVFGSRSIISVDVLAPSGFNVIINSALLFHAPNLLLQMVFDWLRNRRWVNVNSLAFHQVLLNHVHSGCWLHGPTILLGLSPHLALRYIFGWLSPYIIQELNQHLMFNQIQPRSIRM